MSEVIPIIYGSHESKCLEINMSCGATVKIEETSGGFYLEVRQKNELTWAIGSADKESPIDWDLHYIKGYLSDRADLAQAFRDVADFIEESRDHE